MDKLKEAREDLDKLKDHLAGPGAMALHSRLSAALLAQSEDSARLRAALQVGLDFIGDVLKYVPYSLQDRAQQAYTAARQALTQASDNDRKDGEGEAANG
jgi:hypothetical protein